MQTRRQIMILAGTAVLLAVVVGLGIGIKILGPSESEPDPKVQQQESKPGAATAAGQAEPLTPEDEEFLRMLDEEIAAAREAEPTTWEEHTPDASPGLTDPLPHQGQAVAMQEMWQESSDRPEWQRMWMDLELTEEESARLRQGMALIWQRWMNMSPEERDLERQRLEGMRDRWEAMSEEERNEASRRMRDRFEEWRQSGRVELPELSLD